MILAGLDIATSTGIAIANGNSFRAYSFRAKVNRPLDLGPRETDPRVEGNVQRQFRDHIVSMLAAERVEHIAIEKPRTADFGGTTTVPADIGSEWAGRAFKKVPRRRSNNHAMIRAHGLAATVCEVCDRKNIPVELVTSDDWRLAFLGFSRAPFSIQGSEAKRKYLKAAAVKQCALMGIDVPNDDAAEAVGIVFWLQGHLRLGRLVRPGELQLSGVA